MIIEVDRYKRIIIYGMVLFCFLFFKNIGYKPYIFNYAWIVASIPFIYSIINLGRNVHDNKN